MTKRQTLINFIDLYHFDDRLRFRVAVETAQLELDALNRAEANENDFNKLKAEQMLTNFVINPDPETESRLSLLIAMGISKVSK